MRYGKRDGHGVGNGTQMDTEKMVKHHGDGRKGSSKPITQKTIR